MRTTTSKYPLDTPIMIDSNNQKSFVTQIDEIQISVA